MCIRDRAEGGQGQGDDDGDEDGGDAVGEPLGGGLAVLRVLDQLRHPGQLGVRADPRRLDDQPAARVQGRSGDRVAHADLDRDGLAGEHRRVDGRGALDDRAVGGDLLAGADQEAVPGPEPVDRDPLLTALPQYGHVLGAQLQQGLQRGTGLALGAGLEVAPGEDEGGHPCRGLQVDVPGAVAAGDGQLEGVGHARSARAAEEQRPQRPQERRRRADRDQRVHGGRAVPRVGEGGLVERPGGVGDHGRRQGEGQPLPVLELQRRHHRHRDHGHRQHHGRDQPLPQGPQRVGGLTALRAGRGLGADRLGFPGRVPGGLDGGDQLRDRDVARVADLGLLRRVVDGGGDPLHPVELLLDPGGARGTGHAADGEFHLGWCAGRTGGHGCS